MEAGILERTADGNRVYYQATAAFPLLPELQSLFAKTVRLADQVKAALEPFWSVIYLALIFGSVARGEQSALHSLYILMPVGASAIRLSMNRRVHFTATSSRMPDGPPSPMPLLVLTRWRKMQFAQRWVLFCKVVLRRIADQFAGIGNVQALEPVVAEAVQNGELDIFHINAAVDQLVQVAMRDKGIQHRNPAYRRAPPPVAETRRSAGRWR